MVGGLFSFIIAAIDFHSKHHEISITHAFVAFLRPTIHIQRTAVNIIVGSHVWVEDPAQAWLDGQVTKIKGKDVEIQTTEGKTVIFLPNSDYFFLYQTSYI